MRGKRVSSATVGLAIIEIGTEPGSDNNPVAPELVANCVIADDLLGMARTQAALRLPVESRGGGNHLNRNKPGTVIKINEMKA